MNSDITILKIKTVCYTVLIGDYDTLHDPEYVSTEWDYVCFTDQPVHSKIWKIHPLHHIIGEDVMRTSRWHKMHPHRLFPDHDLSIYCDANIQITGPHLRSYLDQFIAENTLIALPPHPERSCVYDEINECLLIQCDSAVRIRKMEQLLKAENFPKQAGLFENNVVIRRHNHPKILSLNEAWWDYIVTYSRRDQLSLTYLLRKHNITAKPIVPEGETIRNHSDYHYSLHKYLQPKPIRRSCRRQAAKLIASFIPVRSWRHTARRWLKGTHPQPPRPVRESILAHQYLDGLDGIEIGASTENGFGLDKTDGAYTTVDFEATQGGQWQNELFKPVHVDIVADGDNLPFENNTLDYVLSSHVIEHFFDPIKAIKEWLRVIRPGGYIFMIVPHKERTFDCNREITSLDELIRRHDGTLTISNYACNTAELNGTLGYGIDKPQELLDCPHLLIADQIIPEGWARFSQDDHHHWSVWTTDSFIKLCRHMDLCVVEVQDPDDKVGNGFSVVIQKPPADNKMHE